MIQEFIEKLEAIKEDYSDIPVDIMLLEGDNVAILPIDAFQVVENDEGKRLMLVSNIITEDDGTE